MPFEFQSDYPKTQILKPRADAKNAEAAVNIYDYMDANDPLRKHLADALKGGQAFDKFEEVVQGFAPTDRGRVPAGAERSAWQVIEHMRLSVIDLVEFSDNENGSYKEKAWPEGYWPKEPLGDWDRTVKGYLDGRAKMVHLLKEGDLYKPFPWGDGQTLLREALLAISHEAYHVGELVELQRWLAAE